MVGLVDCYCRVAFGVEVGVVGGRWKVLMKIEGKGLGFEFY